MTTRRDFLKTATYAAPVIVTLSAKPSYAGYGSGRPVGDGEAIDLGDLREERREERQARRRARRQARRQRRRDRNDD